jgi:hypothetical protein
MTPREEDISDFKFRGETIPAHMIIGLADYIDNHIPTGGFLEAILSNDLIAACCKADNVNITRIHVYIAYLYNNAPSLCFGSPERYREWINITE